MISKVFSGHSFYHACRYVCIDENRSQVLTTEGVRSHNYKLMAEDFIRQHQMRLSKTQACFHSVLCFYPGEKPSDEKMIGIAKEYLEAIGIKNTQYAITKHIDKDHLHLHVLANMVNNEGKSISDSWIALKGKRAAQRLTKEHSLTPALRKNLTLTHIESLSLSEANKYKIYEAIKENLPKSKNIEELEQRLLKLGIEIKYKYKGQTQEKQGLSFKIGEDCFKGSKVDRQFSYANIQKTIELQLKQNLNLESELSENIHRQIFSLSGSTDHQNSQHRAEVIGGDLSKSIRQGIEILMRHEQEMEQGQPKLMEELRRKKKKRQRLHNRGM